MRVDNLILQRAGNQLCEQRCKHNRAELTFLITKKEDKKRLYSNLTDHCVVIRQLKRIIYCKLRAILQLKLICDLICILESANLYQWHIPFDHNVSATLYDNEYPQVASLKKKFLTFLQVLKTILYSQRMLTGQKSDNKENLEMRLAWEQLKPATWGETGREGCRLHVTLPTLIFEIARNIAYY